MGHGIARYGIASQRGRYLSRGQRHGLAELMAAASGYFLVWRLALYAATARGWLWMRRRLLAREPDPEARYRLIRTEVAGVAVIVALEISLLLQP